MIFLKQLFDNKILSISVLSWAVAQLLKIILDLITSKKLDLKLITSSGGMPSSHSSFVTALTLSVGFSEGFNSPLFAACFVLSCIVMYDAAGVRRAAGNQARILNLFIQNRKEQGIKIDEKLKELIGHTPVEVFAGAILGIIIAVLCYL